MILFFKHFSKFWHLFFPKNCVTCGTHLLKSENVFCTKCRYDLPKTNYHKVKNNDLNKIFWGITDVKYATALFFFSKGSKYQKAIHKLKYDGNKDVGIELGAILGSDLKNSVFNEIDIIVPVPLHPNRKKERGYNQSEMIAIGMSETMSKDFDTENFIRKIYTETQTKKTVEERRKNVSSVFEIKDKSVFENKHILIVDDVVTTGSTLIACAEELLKLKNVKISIATLAIA